MTDVISPGVPAAAWLLPTQLLHAINSNDHLRAAAVLEAGLDCDHRYKYGSKTQPALSLCVSRGHLDIVKLLIQWGCSVNQLDSSGSSPLHTAVYLGHTDIAALLLQHRANPTAGNAAGQTPLHLAADRGLTDVIRLLIRAGAAVDRADGSRQTALMLACAHGHTETAQLLLDSGSSAAAVCQRGQTALQLLSGQPAAAADRRLLNSLLAAGASLQELTDDGCTPLHLAVLSGHTGTARCLLVAGADADARTRLGQSALQLAAEARRDQQLLRQLLLHGAQPDAADQLCQTPLLAAARGGQRGLLELLLAAGARPALTSRRWLWSDVGGQDVRRRLVEAAATPPPLAAHCRRSLLSLRLDGPEESIERLQLPVDLRRYLAFNE